MTFTFDDIVEGARAASGAPDPDTDSWREGLEILIRDFHRADQLSERGWGIMQNRLGMILSARMQADAFLRANPAVLERPVERPVFILGAPRTGTTMASYMLDSDPANRSLLRWEAYNLTEPAAHGELKTDPRCIAELAKDDAMLKANPKAAAAHWEPADGPTECVHLLAQDFRSLMLAVLTDTPTYHDWLLFTDMTSAFEHRKRALQILQSTNPGRWVLKMPSDALFIRQIFKTFPDAKVIWTHRDPYAVFGSSVAMRGHSRMIFNKDAGLPYMQKHFPLQIANHLSRPLEFSQERPDTVYHLYYDDLVADPVAQMKQVYSWLGDPWTDAAEAGMRNWIASNPQNRHGKHSYTLEEWGFEKKDLEPYFSDYLRAHPVAR